MENNQIQITSFEELIGFIQEKELSEEQIKLLLEQSMGIYYKGPLPKSTLVERLQVFWNDFQGMRERPLFID